MRTLLFLTGLLPALVTAGGTAEVEQFLNGLTTLQADFHQQVRDSNGILIEESRGQLMVKRPGQFRWETRTPYLQEVVGDGAKIWIYDPDLEQVTVRKQQGALGNTPASLLTHQGTLAKQFDLQPLDRIGGYLWVALQPRNREGGFESLQLAMDGEQLRLIEVVDSLGQRTRIELSQIMRDHTLSADRFQFTPPPGVDVVGEE